MDRRSFLLASAASALGVVAGCSTTTSSSTSTSSTSPTSTSPTSTSTTSTSTTTTTAVPTTPPGPVAGTPAEILARSHVPIVGFHQLREFGPKDNSYARELITPPATLRAQLEAFRDGGFTPVSASAVVDDLQFGTPLPAKPVLLSFDDASEGHYTVALPLLEELGFPAIFFPMTVVFNKPGWLTKDQLREMNAAGMEIGAHTWDHHRLDKLSGDQWAKQITEPKAALEQILGHPVDLMAYPYGMWNQETLVHVAEAGCRAAFQLGEPPDPNQPLLTIRRILPPPTWDGTKLLANLAADF